jgi:hypothetical protein
VTPQGPASRARFSKFSPSHGRGLVVCNGARDGLESPTAIVDNTNNRETHMRIIRRAAIAAAAILAAACATEYQQKGGTGGFEETQLAPDVFRVSFKGNKYTSADRVQDFALLRAAEITLTHNARYFAVVSSKDQTQRNTYVNPGSEYTDRKGYTTYTPATVSTYYTPAVGMMIRIFPTKPKGDHAFDAEFLAKSLRTKYQIK